MIERLAAAVTIASSLIAVGAWGWARRRDRKRARQATDQAFMTTMIRLAGETLKAERLREP